MNEIQNSFLDAIQRIANSTVTQSNATVTVKAEIIEVVSANQGIYKAKYLGEPLTVYANQGMEYSVGSIVYILIPDGDFSNQKFIVGGAGTGGVTSVQEGAAAADKYYNISDNLVTNAFVEPIELCSYKHESKEFTLNEEHKAKFNEYLKNYSTFSFGLKIQTALDKIQKTNRGNYGAILTIPLISTKDSTVTYLENIIIDTFNILGQPYALELPTWQSVNFTIDTENFKLNDNEDIRIKFFTSEPFTSQWEGEGKPNNDIFFSDITFKVVGEIPESEQQGYNMTLSATSGTIYVKDNVEKTIVPTLRYNGKEISNKLIDSCYWFMQDYSVTIESDNYIANAGAGWRCINEVDGEGNPVSATEIIVKRDDNVYESIYKCIIIYDETIITKTITLINPFASVELELRTVDGETKYIEGAGDIELQMIVSNVNQNDIFTCSWARKDKNGMLITISEFKDISIEPIKQVIDIENKKYKFTYTAKFSKLLIDELTTVSCTVVKADGTVLGTKTLGITVGEQISLYRLVINGDDKLYKYDTYGNSPMIPAYDGPVSSIITEIEPLTYKVFNKDGSELTELEYALCQYTWKIPKNSLIQVSYFTEEDEEYYYMKGYGNQNQINYSILSRYNYNRTDNTIFLEVKFNDNKLENKSNLTFLKDGVSGTNGTKYAAFITYNNARYGALGADGRIQKLKVFYDKINSEWYYHDLEYDAIVRIVDGYPTFGIEVYENDDLLTEGYSVSYSWFDEKFMTPCLTLDGAKLSVGEDVIGVENNLHIVQATVSIKTEGNQSVTGGNTTLYAHYPIEVTFMNGEPKLDNIVAIDGGFHEVVYADSGTDPSYDSSEPFRYAGAADGDTVTWSCGGHLRGYNLNDGSKEKKFTPDKIYNDGNTRNYIVAAAADYKTIRPILFIYNRYGMANLNDWDGNKIETGAEEEYLLAPQIGAGKKDKYNTFTGIVMGTRKRGEDTDVGLFGYGQGKQTIFLNSETGGFSFGSDQIVFTPGKAGADGIMNLNKVVLDWNSNNAPTLDDMDDVKNAINNVKTESEKFAEEILGNAVEDLQNQIDGNITTWFDEGSPIETSERPWGSELDKNHIGDLYYDNLTGYAYEFHGTVDSEGNSIEPYFWVRITENSGIVDALAKAQTAQDTADKKRQVFVSTIEEPYPTPPYDIGDLWADGIWEDKDGIQHEHEIVYCIQSKIEGQSFDFTDWAPAGDYTNVLNKFVNSYNEQLTNIQTQVDKKAETWYQEKDPSLDENNENIWNTDELKTQHEGDLWYDINNQITFIYKNGAWESTDIPLAVYDKIDGKASIYIEIPDNPQLNDLLIPKMDIKIVNSDEEIIVYKQEQVYKYDGSTWVEISYATNDDLNKVIEIAEETKELAEASNKLATEAKTMGTRLTDSLFRDTTIADEYVISPYIGGGYLHIIGGEDSESKRGIIIDPSGIDPANTGYIFNIYNGQSNLYATNDNSQIYADEDEDYGKLPLKTFNTVMGVNKEGDAYFSGTVEAETGHIGQFKINNKYIEHESRVMGMGTDANWAFWAGYNSGTGQANFQVKQDGSAKFGNLSISNTGSITANGGNFKSITVDGGNFKSITVDGNSTFKGKLSGASGDFSGKITATEGEIGGWTIKKGQLKAKAGGKWTAVQAPADGIDWVFAAGGTSETSYRDYPFRVDKNGNFVATQATITGNITCTSLDVSGAATIAGLNINKVGGGTNGANMIFNGQVTCNNLVANEGGTIGGWFIGVPTFSGVNWSQPALYGKDGSNYAILTPRGVYGKGISASWEEIIRSAKK